MQKVQPHTIYGFMIWTMPHNSGDRKTESTASLTEGHHFSRNNVWGSAMKHLTTEKDF